MTLWTVAHEAPLSMGYSRQEHWSGLPYPPPGYIPNPGVKPVSLAFPAGSLPLAPLEAYLSKSTNTYTYLFKVNELTVYALLYSLYFST